MGQPDGWTVAWLDPSVSLPGFEWVAANADGVISNIDNILRQSHVRWATVSSVCRLLGYATSDGNASLRAIVGDECVSAFCGMSEIHNDGWGASLLTHPEERPHLCDGGEPSPQTGTKLYRSTIAARHDDTFAALVDEPARGALWHLRLASSRQPLIMENQQPFFANGLSFIHNGDISDAQGRNVVFNRDFPVDRSVFLGTGGRSDSAVFFAVILEYLGFGFALDEAIIQAIRQLRQTYPKSSYNCMVQSEDQLIAVCAAGRVQTPRRVVELYGEYGCADLARDYRHMRFKADEATGTVVVASSGFPQQGWRTLENNQMLVVSGRTGEYRLRTFA